MSDIIADYIALKERRDELEAMLKPVKNAMGELESKIADEFLRLGKTKETRNGTTVYISRNLGVKVTDPIKLVDAMRAMKHEEMLGVNAARLKSFCRDLLHDDRLGEWVADVSRLPEQMRDCVAVSEHHRINARKS